MSRARTCQSQLASVAPTIGGFSGVPFLAIPYEATNSVGMFVIRRCGFCPTAGAAHHRYRPPQHVSLNGEWHMIVDPYDTGYVTLYNGKPNDHSYFRNAKPKSKTDLVEYDFETSPLSSVPGDWKRSGPTCCGTREPSGTSAILFIIRSPASACFCTWVRPITSLARASTGPWSASTRADSLRITAKLHRCCTMAIISWSSR